jgi:hypothetical protein
MRPGCLIPVLALAGVSAHAQYCTGRELDGPYGLQLAGSTTISGTSSPVVGMARIVFGPDRAVSGYSSISFKGLLLGNPVTGNYEVGPDCALSLNLQDDSGAYQHFGGKVTGGGKKAEFHQTDPGTGEQGTIVRASASCNATNLRGGYAFTLAGAPTPVDSLDAATPVSAKGALGRDVKGQLRVTWNPGSPQALSVPATVSVQSDCTVEFEFAPPSGGDPIKLRGILADGGAEILAIETNPGETVAARFTAK